MKKCKFIKSGIAIAILGCSIIFTACDVNTDKKVEKQANKVVDAVESKDITKLDAIINGTDEIKADEELKDFFETDTEAKQKNGLMSKIIEYDTIKVKKVGKDTVTYKITAPDFSKYFTEMKKSEVTEKNIESFTDDYISNAEKVTNEVEIPYTYKDGIYSAEYDTEEFVNALKGNEFYGPLSRIQNRESALLFDYGMALDLYYFSLIWHVRKKLFSGNDLAEITKAYGEKFDMLNLQFIFRSKRYFNMASADIYALLIPMNYKLKKEEISSLVEAASYEETQSIFRKTYYGRKYSHISAQNIEEFYNYMLRTTLEKEARKDPYSVAVLYSYLYHKEHEVNRLTIAIECVRYGIPAEEAIRYIRNN